MKHVKLQTTLAISQRMSKVKLKRNKYEIKLAKLLWNSGYRYHLNYREIPGSPDIVLPKYFIAIFVDGEFWHGKDFDLKKEKLKNNKSYWVEKIEENMARDKRNDKELKELGWIPLHFWCKDIEKMPFECLNEIEEFIAYQQFGKE